MEEFTALDEHIDHLPLTARVDVYRKIVQHVEDNDCQACAGRDRCYATKVFNKLKDEGFIEETDLVKTIGEDNSFEYINNLVRFLNENSVHRVAGDGPIDTVKQCAASVIASASVVLGRTQVKSHSILELVYTLGRLSISQPELIEKFYTAQVAKFGTEKILHFNSIRYLKQYGDMK